VVVRDPLAVALIVYLFPQAFLVWIAGIVRELRSDHRAGYEDPAKRLGMHSPATLLRVLGGVLLGAAAGWLVVQIPVAPVTFLVPWDVAQSWPPGRWWPGWLYWAIMAFTGAPMVALAQATTNRRWKRAGTAVCEGPGRPGSL
jgi:hypothetical protein